MFTDQDKGTLTCGGGCGAGARRLGATVESGVAVGSHGAEVDKAWLVGGDLTEDPWLIFGHSGIYRREIWQGTSSTKTHHSRLDPQWTLSAHQRTTAVTL